MLGASSSHGGCSSRTSLCAESGGETNSLGSARSGKPELGASMASANCDKQPGTRVPRAVFRLQRPATEGILSGCGSPSDLQIWWSQILHSGCDHLCFLVMMMKKRLSCELMYILLKLYLMTIPLLRCAFLVPSPCEMFLLDTIWFLITELMSSSCQGTECGLPVVFYLAVAKSN